ncbi:MAG: DNA repair protein RadC [Burkholderiales bacterium]|nr:DNA repair protein RadC [Pseudomonadota bacterium]MCC7067523.1 DNA repair protein RadC [Burkholderiales bacterium]
MSIRDWPADDRPREKLLERGAQALTDAELLAIFLRVGVAGQSAVELARELLQRFGSVAAVVAAPRDAFCAVHGMGEAKFVQLQATVEIARRALASAMAERPLLGSPDIVRDYLRLSLGHERIEVFVALWLDAQHRLIEMQTLFRGTLAQTSVYPREVVRAALAKNAAAVILAHNHPSGSTQPSQADRTLTRTLKDALALIDVAVLDHCIVGATDATTDGAMAVRSMAMMGEL